MSESLEIDLFWSFRSPWSYLATKRLRQWQVEYLLQVNFRPVYPIAVRTPEFFHNVDPLWFPYFMTDVFRVAEFLKLPFAWPNPDPIVQYVDDKGLRQTGPDQPHIQRLTQLGILAAESGKGIEFADEISSLIWGGTANWHEGDHLAQATGRAGLNLADMDERQTAEIDRLESIIEQNQEAHAAAGHWGVPTCAYQGEAFFGQDRLDVLLWRLRKEGLLDRT
jgi:2-hydroxychromene-2-carboxylate isomerase|tara:strand:+ start:343 stop:1008 length:666 start_codon:yes stop_codon:yes gene_type:complete